VVDEVSAGALEVSERFSSLAGQIEGMERRQLSKDEQLRFAEAALALRFRDPTQGAMQPPQLVTCRRAEDVADDLWSTLNKVQENLLRGAEPAVDGWPVDAHAANYVHSGECAVEWPVVGSCCGDPRGLT
jgi:TolA-binding protein